MKVMCIDDNVFGLTDNYPKFGEIVTVLGESEVYSDCWMIENYLYDSKGRRQVFLKRRFSLPSPKSTKQNLLNKD